VAAGRRRWWPALAGVVISLLLLRWALRGTSAASLMEEIRGAHAGPLLLAVGVATLTFAIRLFRWRLLLRADDGSALPAGSLWHAVAIGFMANNVLPFRAGEFLRCYTAARLTRTRLTAALSSVAVERVFDGLTVVALLTFALFAAKLPSTVTIGGIAVSVTRAATTAGLISVVALCAAGAVVVWPLAAERLVRRTVPSPRIAGALIGAIEGFRHGLGALRSPRRLVAVIAWSLVLWLVNAASFWIAFAAFDLPVGFAGALLLQGLLVFGIAVPSTPGYVGVFEAVISAVLLLYGVTATRGAAYALVYHATTFIPITVLGAWSLARTGLSLGEIRQPITDA
jgi:uncharacterized protein (TIRG00374 family)